MELPDAFGKQDMDAEQLALEINKTKRTAADMNYQEEDDDEDAESPAFPITHEITLQAHTKPVSALTIDPAGSRVVSGSYDYSIKFWDFAGMDTSLRPFKSVEPWPGYQISDLTFSNTGDALLVSSGSPNIKLFDRNGNEKYPGTVLVTVCRQETSRGDMYLRDLKHTK
jgi:WD40 repeat protein